MSTVIQDAQGNEVEVYVRIAGGFVDAIIRAPNRDTFDAAARARGLYYQDDAGEWNLSSGVHLDHLGPVMLTPGTYDADGNELTAPVFDKRHHVNMRIAPPALYRLEDDGSGLQRWEVTALLWTQNGTPVEQVNADEVALALYDVELIDPTTIRSPSRIWS